ncbi:MAG: DUF393 domain-containing protein [Verrucomicrobia bacterium]|nr:DUF393 domain-containing protein [Verrucomicrobiota bacterium]
MSQSAPEQIIPSRSQEVPLPALARHLVLYDGDCSFCTFQMKLLTWLDWFHCLRLAPISDPEAVQYARGVTPDALFEAMHVVVRDGAIHRGARCIRFVSLRLPLLIPVGLLLWIPGVILIAEWVYKHVSRNRHLLSRWFGCKDACTLLPSRRSHGSSLDRTPSP